MYIALDEANFDWTMKQVRAVEEMYKQGISVQEMSRKIKRPRIEVALLIIDRAEKGYISKEQFGVMNCSQ